MIEVDFMNYKKMGVLLTKFDENNYKPISVFIVVIRLLKTHSQIKW